MGTRSPTPKGGGTAPPILAHVYCDQTGLVRVSSRVRDKGKGKGFPYSIPSVGPGADPGVQAVSLQVTVKSSTWGLAAITFRQACSYLPSRRASPPFGRYQVILLGDRGT